MNEFTSLMDCRKNFKEFIEVYDSIFKKYDSLGVNEHYSFSYIEMVNDAPIYYQYDTKVVLIMSILNASLFRYVRDRSTRSLIISDLMYAFFEDEDPEVLYSIEKAMDYSSSLLSALERDFGLHDFNTNRKPGTFWRYLNAVCIINIANGSGDDLNPFINKYLLLVRSIYHYVFIKTGVDFLMKHCNLYIRETDFFMKQYFDDISPTSISYLKERKYNILVSFSILGVL